MPHPNPVKPRVIEMIRQGKKAVEIAKECGTSTSYVYQVSHGLRTAAKATIAPKTRPVPTGEITPNACIALTIDADHVVSLKVRNPTFQGTLYVSQHGVAYSRPNAKLKPTDYLGFDQLARLVDSGLFRL